jgi:uncharacterized protein (DUF2252 family)
MFVLKKAYNGNEVKHFMDMKKPSGAALSGGENVCNGGLWRREKNSADVGMERRGAGKRGGGQKHMRPAGRHLLEKRRCPHPLPSETPKHRRWILVIPLPCYFSSGHLYYSRVSDEMRCAMDRIQGPTPGVHLPPKNEKAAQSGSGSISDTFSKTSGEDLNLIPPGLGATESADPAKASSLLSEPGEAVSFLHAFNEKLSLRPVALKEKYALMKKDALNFFRATPALFFHDIFGEYSEKAKLLPRDAPSITIDGDMHAGNFGTFKDLKGETVWGINDQDQAGTGSPEWDLERLATSLTILARKAGLSRAEQKEIIDVLGKHYCSTLSGLASGDEKGPSCLHVDECHGPVKKLVNDADQLTQKHLINKYTKESPNGSRLFATGGELQPVSQERQEAIREALKCYAKTIGATPGVARPLVILDACEKLGSGGSSYGLPRYWVLVEGADRKTHPVILELKQLLTPAPQDQSGDLSLADGGAVVENQKKLGGYQNPLTGYTTMDGMAYLCREREAVKDTLDLDTIKDYDSLHSLARQAGQVLARAHGQTKARAQALVKWIGDDEGLLASRLNIFSSLYADQNDADYRALKADKSSE